MPDNTTEAQGATPVERADDVNTDVNTHVDATSSQRSEVTGAEIVFDNVVKKYPGQAKAAVGGMSLRIPAGETVMFVGPSGCGKTTSLKMINRLIDPTSGTITIDGKPISESKADDLRRRIGYVIQGGSLFPHMTVADNIAVVPGLLGWDKAKTTKRVDELLDMVGLDPERYRDRFPRELSGGQQQRVGVARGMGMSQMKTLATVELPLAAPVIMAGVRTALVLLVGTASFATFINAGGLGALIQAGINLFRYPILVSGAILIALLALVFEWAGRVLEAIVTPKGL